MTSDIATINLEGIKVPFDVLKYIPEESAAYYKFVPVGLKNNVLEIGMVDPESLEARNAIVFIASKISLPYKIYRITQADYESVLKNYKGISGEIDKALGELGEEFEDREKLSRELDQSMSDKVTVDIIEDAPVTKIVASIIQHATDGNASDVHIEPVGEKVRVRFRVDGVMYTSLFLPRVVHEAVIARIKILSNIKLDEKRKPQDGRFSAKIEGRKVDFRVSTLPTFFGEKVVLRILDAEKGVRTLDQVSLRPNDFAKVKAALDRPYGMILITGPTGSGKSTTLYAMLNSLDKEGSNIISLEDPIEYNVAGINQSQVFPEIDYTFASGLRSILRQDPDVIMVGEIRDKETAELAVQAALTGHLVLSTLHTNTSVGAITRLIDMGVDPYLIAPTLVLVMGQRLVRTLCEEKDKRVIDEASKMLLEKQFADLPEQYRKEFMQYDSVYHAKPSSTCAAGTRGRIAAFEVLEIDSQMQAAILKNTDEETLYKMARAKGYTTMREDAILKMLQGTVPFEEAIRL